MQYIYYYAYYVIAMQISIQNMQYAKNIANINGDCYHRLFDYCNNITNILQQNNGNDNVTELSLEIRISYAIMVEDTVVLRRHLRIPTPCYPLALTSYYLIAKAA